MKPVGELTDKEAGDEIVGCVDEIMGVLERRFPEQTRDQMAIAIAGMTISTVKLIAMTKGKEISLLQGRDVAEVGLKVMNSIIVSLP